MSRNTFTPGTWTNFSDKLDATFKDINLQKKAAKRLLEKELSIDKEGPEKFFTEYEILARDAGLVAGTNTNDIVHVHNLTRLMPYDLRDRVNTSDPQPDTYARYKRLICRHYPAYKEKADRQRLFRSRQGTQKSTDHASVQTEAWRGPNPPQNANKAPGNPFGAKPKGFVLPEERERRRKEGLCYRCGQKGHIATNCPIRNQDIKPKVKNTTLEATPDEKGDSGANITNSNQKSLELRASLNRDAAEDQDEAVPRVGSNRYAVFEDLEDFHPALS